MKIKKEVFGLFEKIEIKRKSLESFAYDSIKAGIVSGEINNNLLLSENTLAKILNMSRTPIREAIKRLEAESYLKSVDGVGLIVQELSLKDLAEIYEVRIALEKVALESAILKIDSQKIDNLESELENVINLYNLDNQIDDEYLYNLDSKFHNVLYLASENSCVKEILKTLEIKIHRYQYKAYKVSNTGKEATIQHLDILKEVKNKNLEKVKNLLESHIKWSFEILKAAMLKENIK